MSERCDNQPDMFRKDHPEESSEPDLSIARDTPREFRSFPHLEIPTADQLKKLVKIVGLKTKLTRKVDIIKLLSEFPQANPQEFLNLLSDVEKNFLAEAVHNQGEVSPEVFSAKYDGDLPYMKLDYYYGSYGSKEKKEPSALNLVMFFSQDVYEVCPPLKDVFRKALPEPAPLTMATTDSLPDEISFSTYKGTEIYPMSVFESESVALLEARSVLLLAEGGNLQIAPKSRRPTSGTVRHVAKGLVVPDFELDLPENEYNKWCETAGPVRAHAWPVLLQQCGLLRMQNNVLKLTGTAKAFLQSNKHTAWLEAVEHFIADDRFDELNRINNIRGQSGKGKRHLTPPSERKACIVRALSELQIGKWVEFNEFFRYLLALGEWYEVTRDEWTLYFEEQQYGALAYESNYDLQKQYLRAVLMESFSVLGLIDIAYTRPHHLWPEFSGVWGTDYMSFCGRYDGLSYIRLNRLGAWCLGLEKTWTEILQIEKIFTVQPNFEIIASDAHKLSPAHRVILDSFFTKTGEYVWQLDPEAFLKAIENGRSGQDIIDFLEKHAQNDLPAAVRISLESWIKKAQSVVAVEDTLLVRFGNPHDAAIAASDTPIAKIARFVPPDSLVISRKNERALRTALRKIGFVFPLEL